MRLRDSWARWLGKKAAEIAMGTSNRQSIFYASPLNIPFYDETHGFYQYINITLP